MTPEQQTPASVVEAFGPEFYQAMLDHALAALRDRKPFEINADGAYTFIQQAAADRAALTQGESRQTGLSGWQDIATAPKDRTPVLAAIHDDLYPRVCPGRPDLERWNGQRVVVHHPGLCEDGFDIGWSVSAPVGVGVGTDEWFSGWQPLPAAPTPADGGGE